MVPEGRGTFTRMTITENLLMGAHVRDDNEVQADIDKYTISVLLAGQQAGGALARGLHAQLFDRVRYRDDLDRGARRLYENANRYAARFCRQLEDRFLRPRRARVEAMLGELRRFYRLSDAGKLRAIEAA